MADSIDPYYQWLGIPPKYQPPNHYRLLGLELFESDTGVISAAASRQVAHVRTYQAGPNSDLCHQLLNELSAAKAWLVDYEKKAAYDAQLREKLMPDAEDDGPSASVVASATGPTPATSAGRATHRDARPKRRPPSLRRTQSQTQSAGRSQPRSTSDSTAVPRSATIWTSPIIIGVEVLAGVGLVLLIYVLFFAPTSPVDTTAGQPGADLTDASQIQNTDETGDTAAQDPQNLGAELAKQPSDVVPPDNPPPAPQIRLKDIPDQQIAQGREFRMAALIENVDIGSYQLVFQLVDHPPNAGIDKTTGEVHWSPPITQRAAEYDVTFSVLVRLTGTDVSDQRTFKVTVLPKANVRPSISIRRSPISPDAFAVQLTGEDPDGDQLRYEYSLDEMVSWRPTGAIVVLQYERLRSGPHQFFARAIDTSGSASEAAVAKFVVPDSDAHPTAAQEPDPMAESGRPRQVDPFIQQVLLDLQDGNSTRPRNLIDRNEEYYKRGYFLLALYYGLREQNESEAKMYYDKVVRQYESERDRLDDIDRANYVATLNNLAITLVRQSEIDDAAEQWAATKELADQLPPAVVENVQYALYLAENQRVSDRRPQTRITLRELAGRESGSGFPGWLYMAMGDEHGRLPDFDGIYERLIRGLMDGAVTVRLTGSVYRDPWCLAPYCVGESGRRECPVRACKRGTITTRYQTLERDPISGRPIQVSRTRRTKCATCGGDGYVKSNGCKVCGGSRRNPNFSP